MARKKSLCRASNGLYVRNIGWKQTSGGYAQHKFYLGRDEQKAMLAGLRLEQLWEQVTACWQALDPVEKSTRPPRLGRPDPHPCRGDPQRRRRGAGAVAGRSR